MIVVGEEMKFLLSEKADTDELVYITHNVSDHLRYRTVQVPVHYRHLSPQDLQETLST